MMQSINVYIQYSSKDCVKSALNLTKVHSPQLDKVCRVIRVVCN